MARQILFNGVIFPYKTVASTFSQTIDLRTVGDFIAFQVDFQDVTTSYVDFQDTDVTVSTSSAHVAAHNQVTGSLGTLTSTTTLPSPLNTGTNYWLIVLDANNFQFATSLSNAVAGTFVPLTDQGTGRHTFTPTASAGNTITGNMSVTGTSFCNISSLQLISNPASVTVAAGTNNTVVWDFGRPNCKYLNVLYTPASGMTMFQVSMNTWVTL